MSSHEIQSLIINNTEEIQDYLRDLKHWETDIKLEDLKLSKNGCPYSEEAFPVRGQSVTSKIVAEKSNMKQREEKKSLRISSYDYDAWEKFDADKALNSENEEEGPQKVKNNTDVAGGLKEKVASNEHDSLESSRRDRAERLKEEGNKCYAAGKLSDAVAKYTQGMGLNPSNPLLPANRAMAYLKLKKYKAAETDCTKALNLDPKYIKAYLRRATSRTYSSDIEGAIEDYEKVLGLEPWNKDAKRELEKLEGQRQRLHGIVPPLEDARPAGQSSQQLKKMKVAETECNIKSETSTQTRAFPKTIQQKPAVRVPVIEVDSKEILDELIGESKYQNPPKSATKEPSVLKEMETQTPSLPKPPKTSHQLAQDWRRIREHPDLLRQYLKSIDLSFFYGTEIDTDLLLEIFGSLLGEEFESDFAASVVAALMTSRGFFLNLAFFDTQQKKVLESLIEKIDKCDLAKEKIEELRACL